LSNRATKCAHVHSIVTKFDIKEPRSVTPVSRPEGFLQSPPFKRFGSIQRLGPERSGHASVEHVRHQLYVGRDTRTRANALIKVLTKPGLVYERNLTNEIATLSTINRDLPDSRYFPLLWEHGRLPDGRVFLIMSLFDEWPLSTTIGPDRMPHRLVGHVRTCLEVARALAELHRIGVFHVDLNPMNILYRAEQGRPVIRIVDFESSYELARHSTGVPYNPPTTSGFCAPEVHAGPPDPGADVFSLGAVLYTLIAGYEWTWGAELSPRIAADPALDDELRTILLTAVQKDPQRRYHTVDAMSAALAAYLESIWPGRSWS
jgi:serine/threonine protein kinase